MARHLFGPPGVMWQAAGTAGPAGAPTVYLAPGATFALFDQPTGGSPYTDITAPDGVTTIALVADATGEPPWLRGPDNVVAMYCDTGASVRMPMVAVDSMVDVIQNAPRLNATASQHFAGPIDFSSVPTVNGGALVTGGGGGGGGGTVTAAGITDSSAVGRAVLTAADAAAARTAIGAGTGNGTSTLALGTTAGTALAGNTDIGALMSTVANLVSFLNSSGLPYTVYVAPSTGLWPNSGARVHSSGAAMTGFTSRWIWDSQAYPGALAPAGKIDGDIWDERIP